MSKKRLWSPRAGAGTAPRKTNADIEYMVAIVGFIIDALEFIPKPLVAITEIHESLLMNEKFDTELRAEGSSHVIIVPRCADESAEIGNDDVGHSKMVIDKRCGSGDPAITGIVYEEVIERLSKA